ncbi:NADP-dependent oxidoreductase [Acidisphaera sp. S103]|uniref:NADP-dependent oxidoreductase n=1 Tax=Acidisphaera sp. S103 TaxID=1747223 RepID=UPI001C20896B|nr:NADP-dependent oxidoreductase [Acidisphaera sp. S103]
MTVAVPPTKACRIDRFGPPDVITLADIERPAPAAGEILVRVRAAGVGPWDAWIRSGKSALPQPLPLTLGSDLSGIVAAIGPGVTGLRAGDAVFGVTNPNFTGAQADYAVARAGMIALKPEGIDDIDAASVPVVAVTAWQALFGEAGLTRGQTVLIHGAAGNVGGYAVQLARWARLTVCATASAKDLDYVHGLGAHAVIDYRAGRFEDAVHGVDAVIDLVGGDTQARSFSALKRGGVLVSAVSLPDQALAARHGVTARFFLVDVTTERLVRIGEMLQQGILRTDVGAVLPLAAARSAHAMLEGTRPHPRGKIVLRIGD